MPEDCPEMLRSLANGNTPKHLAKDPNSDEKVHQLVKGMSLDEFEEHSCQDEGQDRDRDSDDK